MCLLLSRAHLVQLTLLILHNRLPRHSGRRALHWQRRPFRRRLRRAAANPAGTVGLRRTPSTRRPRRIAFDRHARIATRNLSDAALDIGATD